MNTRLCTVVTAVTLISLTTGCSGMKNFLFGRGARCGLCNKLGTTGGSSCLATPRFGNTLSAPTPAPLCAPAPQQPVAAPQWTAPAHQAPMCQAPVCQAPVCQAPAAPTCGCPAAPVYANDGCGCEASAAYGPTVDPYGSGVVYGSPAGEHIIGERIIGSGPVLGGEVIQGTPLPSTGDNFQARKFDTDGNKILWEEPLPANARPL